MNQRIDRGTLTYALSDQQGAPDLESISKVARKQSKEKEKAGQRSAVYGLLATTAAFKAKSHKFNVAEEAPYYAIEDYRYGEKTWLINGVDATMSICDRSARCGIIVRLQDYSELSRLGIDSLTSQEWKYYYNSAMEETIEQLAKLFCADDKPAELLILPCRGIIKDPLRDRYGFLFRPPAYIEDLRGSPRLSLGAISRLRKPIPLLELLDQTARSSKNLLDLGIRFKLARQLVQSIYILHAAGWVHKKYFLFFIVSQRHRSHR